MKSAQLKTLVNKGLRANLEPDVWTLRNHLFYKPIQNGLLRGLYFNSSGFSSNKFEVVAFVQPLYVPSIHIDLSFGVNLTTSANKQWWEYNELDLPQIVSCLTDKIKKVEEVFFNKLNNSDEFYRYYRNQKKISFHYFAAVAYSSAYSNSANAFHELNDLLSFLRKTGNAANEFAKKVYENTERLQAAFPSILQVWETETRSALKL